MQLTTQQNDLRAAEQYLPLDPTLKRFSQFPHPLLIIHPVGKKALNLPFSLITCKFLLFLFFTLPEVQELVSVY